MLTIFAGKKAQQIIHKHGFVPELFHTILGASGGPKWFVLAGLDRVIVPEFFASSTHAVDIVGTSAGAFRSACLTQANPLSAINRLAHHYSQTTYCEQPTPSDISHSAREILDVMLGEHGVDEILHNPRFFAHFITARTTGLTRFEQKHKQLLGLLTSATGNWFSRKHLKCFYERVTFGTRKIDFFDPSDLGNTYIPMSQANLADALLASGSIPMVMEGIRDIAGAPNGMYRDGGIIDYHFDLKVLAPKPQDALTLYPHFYANPIPGWFDKHLKGRTPHTASYEHTVMLVPSDEFVAALPYGKISDRKDFQNIPAQERIKYWQTILSESDRLGELFMQWTASGEIIDKMQDFQF
jgi:hypothetical protein